MKVGDLVRMHTGTTIYLALDVTSREILVVNARTYRKTWSPKRAYEVVSESR